MVKKIYIKEAACMGCRLCEVYCQQQHSQSKDLIKAFKKESPRALPRVRVEENTPLGCSVRCQHCADAPCASACLTGAITRDPITGIVNVDEERCIGCWTCILACPFGAIRQDKERGNMVKCDMCPGEEVPACVAKCPNEALLFVEAVEEGAAREPVGARR